MYFKNAHKKININRTILYICFIWTFLYFIHPCYTVAKEKVTTLKMAQTSKGELHAFYPSKTIYSEQMQKYIDKVDSISFAWSRIDAEEPSVINTIQGENGNNGFYYPKDYLQPIIYAKSKGKSLQLSIFMDGKDATMLLPYEDKRNMIIQGIITQLGKDITSGQGIYYDGVVIDFEGLRDTDGNGNPILYEGNKISTYFTQFLNSLKQQLVAINKKLYVAVNLPLYYDGYDYKGIIANADRMILMAHDYEPVDRLTKDQIQQYTGYDALKPIDSLAPINQVKQALMQVQADIGNPSDMARVWLQIAFDSAQWQFDLDGSSNWDDLDGTTLCSATRLVPTYDKIKARVDNADGAGQNISMGYNNELQTPYLQYYNKSDKSYNVLIYEDSQSLGAKIDAAKDYGVGGISLWSLGNIPDYDDPDGMKAKLNCWDVLLESVESPFVPSQRAGTTIQFNDRAIEEAVREKLGKPTGNITSEDVKAIYRLKLPVGVKSIRDLSKLTSLEYLDAQNQGISDITPLGTLSSLKVLYLQRNKITDISTLKKLRQLQVLSLNGNKLVDINSLAYLTNLQKLYLRENNIMSIEALKGLNKLKELYLGGNKITDYSPVTLVAKSIAFSCDFK